MTVLNIANIPNSIGTVEELVVWCAYCLRECAPNQALVETINATNFQCDLQESISPDGKPLFIARFVFEQIPKSVVTGKVWNSVREIPRSAEIPSYYLSN